MDFLLVLPKLYLVLAYTAPVVFGFFCAYWAQETKRNAWLWFAFGVLVPPITGIFLLMFNAEKHRSPPRVEHRTDLGSLISARKDVV
ncbi:hypothetical protein [Thermomonas sp.]